ncbi:MAG TPA: hypothetical protein PLR71_03340 [Deltaproteobacteria bacterium]|nr:hypothetical protein [Deltaproteobacteria bacterium]HQI80573.1 hypothetical protein [Deltaproteobacteria bacterium]
MDKQVLEFWGNMMLSAAKGQQQLEDILTWFSGNVRDFKDFSDMFCRMYGIEPGAEQSPDYLALWRKALGEFKESYGELLAMMDLVPRRDFIAVTRENQDLKKRISELEEVVRHLRALLDDKAAMPAGGIKDFQKLIDEQARQYQDFMKGVTAVLETGTEPLAAEMRTPRPAGGESKPAAPVKKTTRRSTKSGT